MIVGKVYIEETEVYFFVKDLSEGMPESSGKRLIRQRYGQEESPVLFGCFVLHNDGVLKQELGAIVNFFCSLKGLYMLRRR
ncbi:MAG: hypothetical protein LBD18_01030 [Treponema sp.]|nr:hypothetical protein [Treponema sp.]